MRLADVKDGVYLVKHRLVQYTSGGRPRHQGSLYPGTYLGKVVTDELVAYKHTGSDERIADMPLRRLVLTNDAGKEHFIDLGTSWSEFVMQHIDYVEVAP